MSPELLALGVLLPGLARRELDPELGELLREGLGGVALFGEAATGGAESARRVVVEIHRAGPGAVVAADEEGGDVTRLHADLGSPVLGAAALGAAEDLGLTEATGRAVGQDLAAAGIDLALAPVADLNTDPGNPVIGIRSFGTDPARAGAHVAAWVRGLQFAGVAACAKHFPGHGDTSDDSHLTLPVVDVTLDTLDARELVPFAAAVAADVAAVMVAHLRLPALDPDRPASSSPAVIGLLRERLGFGGVVVTDALDMTGASDAGGIPDSVVRCLAAGSDLVCLGSDTPPTLVRAAQAAVLQALADGRLSEGRLREACRRVISLRRPTTTDRPLEVDDLKQLAGARQAMTVEGELPDLAHAAIIRIETEPNIAAGDVPWGLPAVGDLGDGRPVVVQVKDAHRHPAVRRQLADQAEAGPVVVLEYGWPAPLDLDLPRICTRGSSRPSVAAAAEVLRSAGWTQ